MARHGTPFECALSFSVNADRDGREWRGSNRLQPCTAPTAVSPPPTHTPSALVTHRCCCRHQQRSHIPTAVQEQQQATGKWALLQSPYQTHATRVSTTPTTMFHRIPAQLTGNCVLQPIIPNQFEQPVCLSPLLVPSHAHMLQYQSSCQRCGLA